MTDQNRVLTVDGLRAYLKANPTKFLHKYGNIDLDNLPATFDLAKYKKQVVAERVRRSFEELSENDPAITPELFAPKPVAPVAKAPEENAASDAGETATA